MTMTTEKKLTKPERWLLIFTALFVCLFGGAGWFFADINADPVVEWPPEPPQPHPNAMTIYLDACSRQVYQLTPPPGATWSLSVDGINDWLCNGKPVFTGDKLPSSGTTLPPLGRMQALMAANAPIFARVRQGFAYASCPPSYRIETDTKRYNGLRALARLMLADGRVSCYTGAWDAGTERFIDICHVGEDLSTHGGANDNLIGIALQFVGRTDCWAAVHHVRAATARKAVRRLEAMTARRVPECEILTNELTRGQWLLLRAMRYKDWRRQTAEPGLAGLPTYLISKRLVLAQYRAAMTFAIAENKKPFLARTRWTRPMVPLVGMAYAWDEVYDRKYTLNTLEHDLLTVSFALRAYRLEHGAYPPILAALVPGYLARVPADPFGNGPLRYARTGTAYTLYSIGLDGVSNNGTPCSDRYLMSESKGDIVAGVNTN
jgi:hypothetical protein